METQVPQVDEKIERTVVGAIIANKGKSLSEFTKLVKPIDFYYAEPRTVYAKIIELSKKGDPIDIMSLENAGVLFNWLINAMAEGVGRENAALIWSAKIHESAQKRRVIRALSDVQSKIHDKELGQLQQELGNALAELEKPVEKKLITDSYDDLLKMELGPVPFAVDTLIPAEGITIISGPPASFKTFVLLDMVLAIARGTKLWGCINTTQSPVLIMDEESGTRILQQRFRALDKSTDPLPIFISTYSGITYESSDDILNYCLEKGIKLVCFDSFVRFLGTSDENSSNDTMLIFQKLKKFCAAGIGVVLIHHHRKSQGFENPNGSMEMRGSSDILASVHSHIVIERKPRENSIVVRHNKLREDKERNPFVLGIESDANGFRFTYKGDLDEQQNKEDLAADAIIAILGSSKKSITSKNLTEMVFTETSISPSTVKKALYKLEKLGTVISTQLSRNTPKEYSLLEKSELSKKLEEEVTIESMPF